MGGKQREDANPAPTHQPGDDLLVAMKDDEKRPTRDELDREMKLG